MTMTRRTAGRLLLGAPAVAAVASGLLGARAASAADQAAPPADAGAAPETPPESGLGKFLAKQEPGLDGAQKDRVRKDVAALEQSLRTLRDFPLGNDVPPAGTFRPLKSRRAAGSAPGGAGRAPSGAGSRR